MFKTKFIIRYIINHSITVTIMILDGVEEIFCKCIYNYFIV